MEISHGSFEGLGDDFSRVRLIVMPAVGESPALNGVRDRDEGPEPSPNLTNVSIDFSRLPESPFRTVKLRFSSMKPISRKVASFPSKSSALDPVF